MKKFTIQTIFLVIIIFLALGVATSKISTNFSFLPQVQKETIKEDAGEGDNIIEEPKTNGVEEEREGGGGWQGGGANYG